jgi:hypothetical protein
MKQRAIASIVPFPSPPEGEGLGERGKIAPLARSNDLASIPLSLALSIQGRGDNMWRFA